MAARGLGKGLDSLIPNAVGESKSKKTGGKLSEPKSSKPSQRVSKRAAR